MPPKLKVIVQRRKHSIREMFAFTCCQSARMGSRMHKQGNEHIDDCLIMLEYREAFAIRLGCLKG